MNRFALSCILVIAIARLAYSQGVAVGVAVGPNGVRLSGFGKVDAVATIEQWNADEKQRMETFLELHIELLKKACDLSEAQVEKLRFLGKGVVTRKLSAGGAQLKNFMIASDLTPGESPAKLPENTLDKLAISGARTDDEQAGVVRFRTRFEQPLFDHPLWIGVLKTNLSAQQFAAYEKFCIERNRRFVDSAINNGIAELDGGASLSPEQGEKIRGIWQEKLYPKATVSSPVNLEEAVNLAKPILLNRELIESALTIHQQRAIKSIDESTHWNGVGWTSR